MVACFGVAVIPVQVAILMILAPVIIMDIMDTTMAGDLAGDITAEALMAAAADTAVIKRCT